MGSPHDLDAPPAVGYHRTALGAAERVPTMPGRSRNPTAVRLVVEPQPSEDLRRLISGRVDLHNVAATGLDQWHEVAAVLRDRDDEVVGGILGDVWGGWLHVKYLWVAPAHRGRGHARALMEAAEAPGLYSKLGYEVFGVLDDCPPGHKQYFLARALEGAPRRRAQSQPRKKIR